MANEIVVAIISLIGLLVVSITGNIILMIKRNESSLPPNVVTNDMCHLLCGSLEAKLDQIVLKLDAHLQYHLEIANRDRYPHGSKM